MISSVQPETKSGGIGSIVDALARHPVLTVLAVLFLIGYLGAQSVPMMLHSKLDANETSAVVSLRTINTAAVEYSTTFGGYPAGLTNLAPATTATSASADLIDSVLASGEKSGYVFSYVAGRPGIKGKVVSYTITATPVSIGTTGQRGFFSNQSGIIRADGSGTANIGSAPISQLNQQQPSLNVLAQAESRPLLNRGSPG